MRTPQSHCLGIGTGRAAISGKCKKPLFFRRNLNHRRGENAFDAARDSMKLVLRNAGFAPRPDTITELAH
jgi:hypothetical protein